MVKNSHLKEWMILRQFLISAREIAKNLNNFEDDKLIKTDVNIIQQGLFSLIKEYNVKLSEHQEIDTINKILRAFVYYLDEWILVNFFKGAYYRWQLLQETIYKTNNGGNLFYSELEGYIKDQNTNPIILEVLYFLLKDGFVGANRNNSENRERYLKKLELMICKTA